MPYVKVQIVKKRLADGSVKEYRYELRERGQTPHIAPDSLGALIVAYRLSPEWAALKPRTIANKNVYLRELERLAHSPVKEVKRKNVIELRNVLARTRGNGAATIFIRTAAALFTWAVDNDHLEHSPLYRMKALQGGHLPAWTAAEADEAIARLPSHLARVVLLARYTGQRRGDLVALTWRAYDGTTLTIAQEKGRKAKSDIAPVVIKVDPDMRQILDEWKREATSTFILTNERGRPWDPIRLSQEMPRALAALGFRQGLNIHGLRKLAAAELAESGSSTKEIMSVTGHRTLAMVELYTRSAEQKRLAESAINRRQSQRNKPE